MSDAPEKVWVHYEPETDDAIWSEYPDMDGLDEFNHYGEYTRSDIAQARIDELTKVLERLEHWFDTDDEILEDMGIDELEDHKRQHRYILATLKGTNK